MLAKTDFHEQQWFNYCKWKSLMHVPILTHPHTRIKEYIHIHIQYKNIGAIMFLFHHRHTSKHQWLITEYTICPAWVTCISLVIVGLKKLWCVRTRAWPFIDHSFSSRQVFSSSNRNQHMCNEYYILKLYISCTTTKNEKMLQRNYLVCWGLDARTQLGTLRSKGDHSPNVFQNGG